MAIANAPQSSSIETLTPAEGRHLRSLETRIQRGLAVFREVGMALMEIRDSRLYRGEFKSFEDYAVTRWGLERQRAYQLIGAVEVVKALGKDGPVNEGQARELVPILHNGKPEIIKDVWKEVQASGKPITAASIREVVRQHVIPTVGVPTPTETQRIVGNINRLTLEVAKWLNSKPKPKAKDKAAVEGAMSKLVSTLRGESS